MHNLPFCLQTYILSSLKTLLRGYALLYLFFNIIYALRWKQNKLLRRLPKIQTLRLFFYKACLLVVEYKK